MKREIEDEEQIEGGNKKNRHNDDVIRLLIPSRIAGAVIGKGGQHIQKMRSQYKATVSVDDCQGPERAILISSDLESALSIVKEMLKYFEEKDDEVDVRMLIHQSLAGCVIGKGGTKIKEVRDRIGCRILKVFSNVAPQSTDRIVQIVGKEDQCVDAIREVLNVTRETPVKGSIHNYDPINYDDLYADEYGGYGGTQNSNNGAGGRGGMRGGDRLSRIDRRGDGGGRRFGGGMSGDRGGRRHEDRSRSDGPRDREYINPWANNGPGGLVGGGSGFSGNMGGGFRGPGGFGGGSGGFGGGPSGFGGGSGNFGGSGSGYGGSGNNYGSPRRPSFGNNSGGGNFGSGGNFGILGNGAGIGGGSNMPNGIGGGNIGGGNFGVGSSGSGYSSGVNNGGSSGADNKSRAQVTIPKELAGAIIGKGGGRIKHIRNESGAHITIDEPLQGSNERIITITGDLRQIQMAQYLLKQSVHENQRTF